MQLAGEGAAGYACGAVSKAFSQLSPEFPQSLYVWSQ